ncbi:lysoplasmalogenase [Piscinibacter sp.]|uniref:lysoplasmalogenase n=1 Tax=Piscinibacter sp. TaxID=1903157 RepID=UPI0039E4C8EF
MWSASALVAAWLASAALAIASAPWALAQPWMNFVFKPLATVLVIAHAWPRGRDTPQLRRWVLAGLVLSLAGDVALLWPQRGFLPGLVSFLLAHLAYLWAFTRRARLAARRLPFAVYALVAGAVLWLLWPGVPGALRIPVLAYVACLAAMAAQAAVLWPLAPPGPRRRRAAGLALGGALFVLSDALLATNRFTLPLPAASLWILASYWAAQWLIASWLAPPFHSH